MNIVVDCNVIISAGISDGVCRQVVQTVLSDHTWIVSVPILEEYEEVRKRPKFQKFQFRFTAILESIAAVSFLVEPEPLSLTLPDPDDVVYVETACAGNADIVITGNGKDFPDSFRGIQILTPREFLDRSFSL